MRESVDNTVRLDQHGTVYLVLQSVGHWIRLSANLLTRLLTCQLIVNIYVLVIQQIFDRFATLSAQILNFWLWELVRNVFSRSKRLLKENVRMQQRWQNWRFLSWWI